MKSAACALALALMPAPPPAADGPASGTVTSPTGTIAPKFAVAYVVRDSRHARDTSVELLLTDVPVDATRLRDELDPHVTAINFNELRDRNYLLLWVRTDGSVTMNATYSKTMTQYLNDTAGGLKAELTVNTPAKIQGRVFSPSPLKTMDGSTYTIDVTFSADVVPALSGAPLPAGGGDPGKAFTAFLAALAKKDWAGIKAGLSPRMLPNYDHSYDTPAENLASAVDILNARLPVAKAKITGGKLVSPTVAVLEMESERFASPVLSLIRMVKTGAVWQYDDSVPAGSLR